MRAISSALWLPFKGVWLRSRWGDSIYNCMSLNVPDLCIEVQNQEELSCGNQENVDRLLKNSLVRVAKDKQ